MMLRAVVFVVGLAVVLCQSSNYKVDFDLESPSVAGCCTPAQWEGYEGIMGGYSRFIRRGVVRGLAKVSYDATNQRMATFSNITEGKASYVYQIIQDYKKGNLYIVNVIKRRCRVVKLQKKFKKACIPANAKKIGDYYYGAGTNKLNVVGYHVKANKAVEATVSVTRRGCIPVGEILSGRVKGVSFFDTVGFVDITSGIKDPSVFSPPKFCEKTDNSSWEIHDSMLYRQYRTFGMI